MRIETLKSTSSSMERNGQYAGAVGERSPKKDLSGEAMQGFNTNTAKSLLGSNVNLHLKDGSVIVNVLLAEIRRDEYDKKAFIKCIPYGRESAMRVPLRNVAWAELLNLNLIRAV